jgi:beta-1,4-mannosyl-glycoprotein beta-1,4-N-acetylglucosaminyltransferase
MIYDCFPFFNELDLLEIRLNELDPVVDKFILVEATKTFQKQPKPLYFAENKDRFKQFEDKIIHIVINKFPGFFYKWRFPKAWDYSNFQKDQIIHGLKNCKPGDKIIFSDLDEIPRAEKVREAVELEGIKVFQQKYYNYFLNCIAVKGEKASHITERDGIIYWHGSVMIDFEDFESAKKTRLYRDQKGEDIVQIEDGGWHFSFLGGWEIVRTKLDAWEHASEEKYNPDHLSDPDELKKIINSGSDLFGREFRFKFIEPEDDLPQFLLDNMDRFSNLINN